MSAYHAPLTEIRFVLRELAGLDQVGKLPGFEDATHDTVDAILEEAARFASEVLRSHDHRRVFCGLKVHVDGIRARHMLVASHIKP